MDMHSVLVYGGWAFVYGMFVYISKHATSLTNGNGPVEIKPRKLLRTIIVGLVVGAYAASHGTTSMAGIKNILPVAVPLGDQAVKVIWSYFNLDSVLQGLGLGGNTSGGSGN